MGNDAAIQKDSKKSSKPARDHDQTTEVWSSFLFWWMVTTTAIFVGLLCALACICCTTRSRWLQVKLAFWKRHSISTPLQKDAIKLAWAIDDFDQWSTSLTPRQDTEHERLLLAVNPNYWKAITTWNKVGPEESNDSTYIYIYISYFSRPIDSLATQGNWYFSDS